MSHADEEVIRVAMNGVTGRMGYNQHLVRSLLAINADGGVPLSDERRIRLEPILVGRSKEKLRDIAERHGIADWTTSLDEALDAVRDGGGVYFDAQVTSARYPAVTKAIAVGAHVYVEKPSGGSLEEATSLAEAAREAGIKHGVVQDKLFLPGLLTLRSPHRRRVLRPDPVRARRVRLLGLRGRLADPAATLVELPRRRRRRHRARHVPALDIRARRAVRDDRRGHREGRDAHSAALGRTRRALRRHR